VIVVDTNVISYLLIEGQETAAARTVWTLDPEWRVPPLWRSEFLNVLATTVRARVLDGEQARLAWRRAVGLFGHAEVEPVGEAVLDAAVRDGVSAYDAQFLVTAELLGVHLVTADRKLARARPDVVRLLRGFASSGGH
jgi:predicted nucleic acid-binding protein